LKWQVLDDEVALQRWLTRAPLALLMAGAPECGICQVLKPKLPVSLATAYPRLAMGYLDVGRRPQEAAQWMLYRLPTLILFVEGRESFRWAGSFSVSAVAEAIARPYGFLYAEQVGEGE